MTFYHSEISNLNSNPDKKYNLSSNKLNKDIIKNYIHKLNPNNKKVVTITIRNYFDSPARNSNLEHWHKAIKILKRLFYCFNLDTFELRTILRELKAMIT